MASLFIKDDETADEVRRMARRVGVTQTEVVRRGMQALDRELSLTTASGEKPDFVAWLKEHRRAHPLPPRSGPIADKAFFDRLWGEPD